MSALALHRMIVRLAHDAELVALLARAPERALAGSGLGETERRWLTSVDPRAFTADPEVAARTLRTLVWEARVPAALAAASAATALIRGFFGTDAFHQTVQEGRSLSVAFCLYLAEMGERGAARDDRVSPSARLWALRQAIARGARSRPMLAPGEVALHPAVAVEWFPAGILEVAAALGEVLTGVPPDLDALATAARQASLPSLDFTVMRPVQVRRARPPARVVHLSYIEPALMHLLEALRRGRGRHVVGEVDEIDELVAEGLLLAG